MHHTPLIATIVAGLSFAFIFGALAQRFRVSPLVGYLLAGIIVGPFTPGYVADQELAVELAEIGVILLMFGVGLHFSLKDLLSVRKIAIPGAVAQMGVATLLGMGLAWILGWTLVSGFVFGLALSVASTVVLLRALQERRILQTDRGRIAVGWLIVEDLAMVLALVMLPALAGAMTAGGGGADIITTWVKPLGLTMAKVAGFVAFMLIVGRRIIPWVLHYVAHTGSRELFRLAVLAIALGVAFGAAMLFGVSFALGAFFAGMILAESELSQRAAEETLPLRDAFAVLFFVSVGMLFNPFVIFAEPWPLLATIGIIVIGKSLVAYAIVRLFKHSNETALTVAASLAQIGEFSFILAGLGVSLGLLPREGRDLILGGAILSIVLNPLIFTAITAVVRRRARPSEPAPEPANDLFPTALTEHTVLVGYGRVGRAVAEGLEVAAQPFLIIEDRSDACARAGDAGFEVIAGNGADQRLLAAARISEARRLLVAVPDGFEAGQIVEQARRANPAIEILARAHSDEEEAHLKARGADETIMGEYEIARAMLARMLPSRPLTSALEPAMPDLDPEPSREPAPAPGRPILDDVERAVLGGLAEHDIGPGEAISRQALFDHARRHGAFEDGRLDEAVASLVRSGCMTDLGDGRVAPTKAGFIAASGAVGDY